MTACETWIARDWLQRHNRPLDIPPCDHHPDDCPPTTQENQ